MLVNHRTSSRPEPGRLSLIPPVISGNHELGESLQYHAIYYDLRGEAMNVELSATMCLGQLNRWRTGAISRCRRRESLPQDLQWFLSLSPPLFIDLMTAERSNVPFSSPNQYSARRAWNTFWKIPQLRDGTGNANKTHPADRHQSSTSTACETSVRTSRQGNYPVWAALEPETIVAPPSCRHVSWYRESFQRCTKAIA